MKQTFLKDLIIKAGNSDDMPETDMNQSSLSDLGVPVQDSGGKQDNGLVARNLITKAQVFGKPNKT